MAELSPQLQWRRALRDAPHPGEPHGITSGEQHLGLILVEYMNAELICCPSMTRLARDMRVSEQSVRRHQRGLSVAGWIDFTPSGAEARGGRLPGGKYRTGSYRGLFPLANPDTVEPLQNENPSTVTVEPFQDSISKGLALAPEVGIEVGIEVGPEGAPPLPDRQQVCEQLAGLKRVDKPKVSFAALLGDFVHGPDAWRVDGVMCRLGRASYEELLTEAMAAASPADFRTQPAGRNGTDLSQARSTAAGLALARDRKQFGVHLNDHPKFVAELRAEWKRVTGESWRPALDEAS